MATSLTFSFSLTLITFFLTLPTTTTSSSTSSFVYGGCSHLKYTSSDDDTTTYTTNLNSLLTSLLNSATYSSYYHLTTTSTTSTVHGLYQCRGDLPMPDCATCVAHSVTQLPSFCPGSCGAAIQLQGCYVKYDNDSFIGKQDTTVVFKKCGPPLGGGDNDGGVKIVARDAVLDGLVDGSGLYRVGGSKDVEGVAQCVGDLSSGECKECVTEAVGEVKRECGKGGYGDVYLGKCYVSYTFGGSRRYSNSNNNGSEKNKGVKTFAIVIGLLAAIAILVIFFTFICRSFAGSGGK